MSKNSLESKDNGCLGVRKSATRACLSILNTGKVPQQKPKSKNNTKKPIYDGFSDEEIALSKLIRTHYDAKFTKKRIPQEVVAQQMGLTQGTLNLYINGRKPIGYKPLLKFSKILNIPMESLTSNNVSTIASDKNDLDLVRAILSDLVNAIDSNQDFQMIMKKAKHVIK